MSKNPCILRNEEKQNVKKSEAHSHEKDVEKEKKYLGEKWKNGVLVGEYD